MLLSYISLSPLFQALIQIVLPLVSQIICLKLKWPIDMYFCFFTHFKIDGKKSITYVAIAFEYYFSFGLLEEWHFHISGSEPHS